METTPFNLDIPSALLVKLKKTAEEKYTNVNEIIIASIVKCIEKKPKIKSSKKKSPTKMYGEFVQMTEEEFGKLLTKFGKTKTYDWVESLDNYIGSKGKKYKSHYRTILMWSKDSRGGSNVYSNTSSQNRRAKQVEGGTKYPSTELKDLPKM
jgi:hypothetical protein